MRNYVTYKRKEINDHFFADPNTWDAVYKETWWLISLNETPYQNDGVFISWIEYGDDIKPEQLVYFQTLDPDFEFKIVDESTINNMLQVYGKDDNGNYYVSVKDFIFIDKRPEDES